MISTLPIRLPILALLLTLATAAGAQTPQSPKLPTGVIVLEPRPAPALALNNTDGEPFDLSQSRGVWHFVHFWASWCGPCRKEMPTIATLAAAVKDLPIRIVLVNTAETEDTVFSFLGLLMPDFSPLLDLDGAVTERWQPRGLPATFLVDPSGQLRYQVLGGRDWSQREYIDFLFNITKIQ